MEKRATPWSEKTMEEGRGEISGGGGETSSIKRIFSSAKKSKRAKKRKRTARKKKTPGGWELILMFEKDSGVLKRG